MRPPFSEFCICLVYPKSLINASSASVYKLHKKQRANTATPTSTREPHKTGFRYIQCRDELRPPAMYSYKITPLLRRNHNIPKKRIGVECVSAKA